MHFERQDIGLGLFVLGAAAVIVAGLVGVAGILEGEKIDLHVAVDRLPNVRRGTAVYVEGYRVGEISKIEPVYGPPLHFDLTLTVDAEFPLYEGTSAAIGSQGFIGDEIVELQMPEERGDRLQDGASIPHIAPPDLSMMIGRADTLAQAIEDVAGRLVDLLSPENAGALLDELTTTIVSARGTFSTLENQIVMLADSLRTTMGAATRSLETVSGVLQENRTRISSTLDSTQAMIGELRSVAASAGATVDSTRPNLVKSIENLEAVLADLQELLADLNRYSLWQMLFKVRHPDSTDVKR